MAEAGNESAERTITVEDTASPPAGTGGGPVLRLKLKKPKNKKKVAWTTETVDNENMNKKKSKCCCVYKKPHRFGESSSETDDECEHCQGHTEKKKSAPSPESQEA